MPFIIEFLKIIEKSTSLKHNNCQCVCFNNETLENSTLAVFKFQILWHAHVSSSQWIDTAHVDQLIEVCKKKCACAQKIKFEKVKNQRRLKIRRGNLLHFPISCCSDRTASWPICVFGMEFYFKSCITVLTVHLIGFHALLNQILSSPGIRGADRQGFPSRLLQSTQLGRIIIFFHI